MVKTMVEEGIYVREGFDFFDIVDDFSGEEEFLIDDAFLDEIFGAEDKEKMSEGLLDYLDDFVESKDQDSEEIAFYKEYVSLLTSFAQHYENVKSQYPGLYSTVKDPHEKSEKLMKVAIRDCSTELLGNMVVAGIYDKHHFLGGLKKYFIPDPFDEYIEKDIGLTDKVYHIGDDFNKMLHFAEDTLTERQRVKGKHL